MKPTVLIVDDIIDNIELLSSILEKHNINIKIAHDGKTALDMISNLKPDLILLDIMMPGMSGFEVCEKLKSDNSTKIIPIIFLTAKNEQENIIKGFKLGAVDYITKPFNETELIARVNTHLELWKKTRELNYTQENLKTILNNISDAIFIHDEKGNFIELNDTTVLRFGYSKKEMLLMNIEDICIPQNFISFSLDIEEIKKYGKKTFETILITKNNEFIPHEITLSSINYKEKIAYIVSARDITDRKKLEHNIKKLSVAVEQSPVTIVITDLDGTIEYANPHFTKLSGYTLKEAIGKNPRILKTSKTKPEVFVDLWKTISMGKTWDGEFINKKKNGEEFIERAIISPIKNNEGGIINYIAIKEDITEKKKIEQKLITTKNLLEEKNKNIIDSIKYAKVIQTAVSPSEDFLTYFLPDNFIINMPKDIVSGDFFWLKQKENQIFITVADCTGHGVPGAFLSMLGIAYLNEIINNYQTILEIKASEVLNILRKRIKLALHQDRRKDTVSGGMDMAFCIINLEDRIMQYAGAYNPLFLIRKDKNTKKFNLQQYIANRQPISVHLREKPFTNIIIELQKDDMIYLFTDGYQDQFGGDNKKKFTIKKFKNLLLSNCYRTMPEQKQILINTLNKWQEKEDQIDDILIVGFKILEKYGEVEFF